jgi:hypothetical protein
MSRAGVIIAAIIAMAAEGAPSIPMPSTFQRSAPTRIDRN